MMKEKMRTQPMENGRAKDGHKRFTIAEAAGEINPAKIADGWREEFREMNELSGFRIVSLEFRLGDFAG